MYLLQLVQALKYENFNDIQGGLEPASKRDSQGGLGESSTLGDLDRSAIICLVFGQLFLRHMYTLKVINAMQRSAFFSLQVVPAITTPSSQKGKEGTDAENLEVDI